MTATTSIVISTVGNEEDAKRLAHAAVESRAAACVQMLPIKSVYRWEGKTVDDGEILMLFKTRKDLYQQLKDLILKNHPYEVPEIVEVDASNVFEGYLAWINKETT